MDENFKFWSITKNGIEQWNTRVGNLVAKQQTTQRLEENQNPKLKLLKRSMRAQIQSYWG